MSVALLNAGVQQRANEIERAKRAHPRLLVGCNARLCRRGANGSAACVVNGTQEDVGGMLDDFE